MGETKINENMTVPGAIVVAGVIIAIAIIYTSWSNASINSDTSSLSGNQKDFITEQKLQKESLARNVKPVSNEEHILGNPNAPVKIIEFSDIECPFCKRFHSTMKQVMEVYGKNWKVTWVYRHFPLQIHPKATPEAYATECAAEQGGNDMFWKYLDVMFNLSASNNQTDPSAMTQAASNVGLDVTKFKECLDSGKYENLVKAHIEDGLNAGVSGTPYSLVIGKDDKIYPINGAFPYETVAETIDIALGNFK